MLRRFEKRSRQSKTVFLKHEKIESDFLDLLMILFAGRKICVITLFTATVVKVRYVTAR